MQLDFSDEQKALRDSLRRNLEKNCPISSVRAIIDSAAGHDVALWRNISQGGFLAAAIPEDFGGVGAGYLELCVAAEECGRALAPLPTVSSVYQATEFLLAAGSDAQKAALSRGERPGPENSIGKLVAGAMMQDIAIFALSLEGEAGLILDSELAPDRARFQAMLLRSPATRIEGGSDEILRNIIAERVLGLPADIRA